MPVVISFTVETDGTLPTASRSARRSRRSTPRPAAYPAYYMVNCAHPTHFAARAGAGRGWVARIGGVRANASTDEPRRARRGRRSSTPATPTSWRRQYAELRDAPPAPDGAGRVLRHRPPPHRRDHAARAWSVAPKTPAAPTTSRREGVSHAYPGVPPTCRTAGRNSSLAKGTTCSPHRLSLSAPARWEEPHCSSRPRPGRTSRPTYGPGRGRGPDQRLPQRNHRHDHRSGGHRQRRLGVPRRERRTDRHRPLGHRRGPRRRLHRVLRHHRQVRHRRHSCQRVPR